MQKLITFASVQSVGCIPTLDYHIFIISILCAFILLSNLFISDLFVYSQVTCGMNLCDMVYLQHSILADHLFGWCMCKFICGMAMGEGLRPQKYTPCRKIVCCVACHLPCSQTPNHTKCLPHCSPGLPWLWLSHAIIFL